MIERLPYEDLKMVVWWALDHKMIVRWALDNHKMMKDCHVMCVGLALDDCKVIPRIFVTPSVGFLIKIWKFSPNVHRPTRKFLSILSPFSSPPPSLFPLLYRLFFFLFSFTFHFLLFPIPSFNIFPYFPFSLSPSVFTFRLSSLLSLWPFHFSNLSFPLVPPTSCQILTMALKHSAQCSWLRNQFTLTIKLVRFCRPMRFQI